MTTYDTFDPAYVHWKDDPEMLRTQEDDGYDLWAEYVDESDIAGGGKTTIIFHGDAGPLRLRRKVIVSWTPGTDKARVDELKDDALQRGIQQLEHDLLHSALKYLREQDAESGEPGPADGEP